MCFHGDLGESIIKTLSGSWLVEKMAVCLHFYPQTINIKWLFVNMSGNEQGICGTGLMPDGHVKQLGHVYCLH